MNFVSNQIKEGLDAKYSFRCKSIEESLHENIEKVAKKF